MKTGSILHLGLDSHSFQIIEGKFPDFKFEAMTFDEDDLIVERQGHIDYIFCGYPSDAVSLIEVAQTLRLQYSASHIVLISDKKVPYNKKDLIKNGFNDVFFFPTDKTIFENTLESLKSKQAGSKMPFVPIKVSDLINIEDFDIPAYVYLPANDRYVPFNASGAKIEEHKKRKMEEMNLTTLHIYESDLPQFYQCYANSIKAIQNSDKLSETEKRNILKVIIRELIADLFTEEVSGYNKSLKVNESCKEIIMAYIQSSKDTVAWYNKMMSLGGEQEEFYTHSANAMIATTLFAIGLGFSMSSIESLAIASLMHDIGLSRIPIELLEADYNDLSPENKLIYSKHPELSIETLKEKKVVLTELSFKIILQQHERFDGLGYPNGISGAQVCKEAQILNLINTMLKKMTVLPKKKMITFKEAFEKFRGDYISNPSNCIINPTLLNEVNALFNPKASKINEDSEVSSA